MSYNYLLYLDTYSLSPVSMTPIVGIFAALAAGPLVEWMGPQRVLTMNMGLTTVLWLLFAFLQHKVLLYVSRAGMIACVYIISAVSIPMLAELSPHNVRGLASSMAEVSGSIGVLYGYMVAFLFPWRLATALCTLTSGIFLVPICFVPEVRNFLHAN